MIRSLSLRARLTAWYSVVLLAVLCVFGVIVVWQQGRIGMRRVDRELEEVTGTLVNVLQDELSENSNPAAAALDAHRTMAVPGRPLAILGADGRILAAGWNGLTLGRRPTAHEGLRVWTEETAAGAWRVRAQPETFGAQTFVLLAAAPLADVFRERREAEEAMAIGIPIVLLLAAGGGLWLAAVGLRPITIMAERAANLAPGGMEDLGQSERADELGRLARAFNGLVARLRLALQTQRRFMADASHELRTPVSVVQSTADVMLARAPRDESEYRDALASVGAQARRLGRLVEDMLVLARADAGGYPLQRVSLYLNELVAECQQTLDVLACERGVSIHSSAGIDTPFCGDEELLRRMLLNVIQNAVEHTRAGGAVRVELSPNGHQLAIRVRDQGPGIRPGDQARIFDRFVQLDPARRGAGAGLGLPIARWIADAHGGSLEVEDSGTSGSTFRILLPLEENEHGGHQGQPIQNA